jgi:choline dehydrogenase-like flavoprotein
MPAEEVLALLERWRHAGFARRAAVRMLMTPLKLSHFNDPELYRQVGCVFGVDRPVKLERPRYLERVIAASSLADGELVECDVVLVGSGAGGAVAAKELAERGVAVLLVEEGQYHQRDAFTGHAVEMQQKLYRDMGATMALGNAAIPIPLGRAVGGTTVINSGTCYRTPDAVLAAWGREHGLHELAPEHMAPHFERVEAVLGVAPADKRYLGGVADVIARGCEALGYAHRPLLRNAPDCDGKGVCCFGCPTDAKRSTNVSYVPLALEAGAMLMTGAKVDRILTDGDRAIGVSVRTDAGRVVVRARSVVIACGALLTPVLLEQNHLGSSSGQLGRNLSIHPAVAAMALFDEHLGAASAIPQGYAIEEFRGEGLLFEGVFAPLDVGAATVQLLGPRLIELLEAYDRAACFGFMIADTSRGRVRPGPGGRPLVSYVMNDNDVARIKRGIEILARVYFAAGAKVVLPLVHGFDELSGEADLERFRRARLSARDLDLSAYHPLSTARMGRDPRSSVVDANHQVHDCRDLYVMDGSALPSSPEVNPQLSIMALATRAALRLAERL